MANSFNPQARPSLHRLATEMKLHQKMVENGILPSCISCEHWGMNQTTIQRGPDGTKPPKEEVCRLYSMRPPAEVIVMGCDQWEWDLPF